MTNQTEITLSDNAKLHIAKVLEKEPDGLGLRVHVLSRAEQFFERSHHRWAWHAGSVPVWSHLSPRHECVSHASSVCVPQAALSMGAQLL